MPLTNLNIGAAPNDGTGETLRSGGAKINTNYTFTVTTDTTQDIGGVKTFTGATTRFNGRVGIGQAASSTYSLAVANNGALPSTTETLILQNSGAQLRFEHTSAATGTAVHKIIAFSGGTGQTQNAAFAFETRSSGVVAERMRIAADGGVSIGSTTSAGAGTLLVENETRLRGSSVVFGPSDLNIKYHGQGNPTGTTGTVVFKIVTGSIGVVQTALVKITVQMRAASNTTSTAAAAVYFGVLHFNSSGNVTFNGAATIFEFTFVRATHLAFANLGSNECTITLTNPTSATSLVYELELIRTFAGTRLDTVTFT
jgi:hypothetical protein